MVEGGQVMQPTVLGESLRVINIGLASFAEDLRKQSVQVIDLDWRPPAGGDARLAALLADMEDEEPAPCRGPSPEEQARRAAPVAISDRNER
jgi:hypothetical protein